VAIWRFVQHEPAIVTSVIVALLVTFGFQVDAEARVTLHKIVDAVLILIGGGIVRQSVTPVAKLREQP